MKFTNLKKFLATITLGAMSVGFGSCNPIRAITKPKGFEKLSDIVHENFLTNLDKDLKYAVIPMIVHNLYLCILTGNQPEKIMANFDNAFELYKKTCKKYGRTLTLRDKNNIKQLLKTIFYTKSPGKLYVKLVSSKEDTILKAGDITTFMVRL